MDQERFDQLTRTVSSGASRRGLRKTLTGTAMGGLLVVVGLALGFGGAVGGAWGAHAGAQATPATACQDSTPEQNAELVRRYFEEVYNGRRLDVVDELLADDFGRSNAANPHENEPGNDDDVRRVQAWLDAFPDLRITIDDLFAAGDRVAVRSTWTGTQRGPLAQYGAPATDRYAEWGATIVYRVECGELQENWVTMDFLTLFRQLGIVVDDELADADPPTVATPTP